MKSSDAIREKPSAQDLLGVGRCCSMVQDHDCDSPFTWLFGGAVGAAKALNAGIGMMIRASRCVPSALSRKPLAGLPVHRAPAHPFAMGDQNHALVALARDQDQRPKRSALDVGGRASG